MLFFYSISNGWWKIKPNIFILIHIGLSSANFDVQKRTHKPWKFSPFLMLFRTTSEEKHSLIKLWWIRLISSGVSFKSGIRLRNEFTKVIIASSFVIESQSILSWKGSTKIIVFKGTACMAIKAMTLALLTLCSHQLISPPPSAFFLQWTECS